MPDHTVSCADRLINCRARNARDDHPEDRRDHAIGKILCQAFDCGTSHACLVECLGIAANEVRYRFPAAAKTIVLERIGNTCHMLMQTSLGDQRAAEDGGTDQPEWQNEKSALNNERRYGHDAKATAKTPSIRLSAGASVSWFHRRSSAAINRPIQVTG